MFKSAVFRRILLVRFLGYFFIQAGFITLLLIAEPVITEEVRYYARQLFGGQQNLPRIVTSQNADDQLGIPVSQFVVPTSGPSRFADVLAGGSEIIVPVSTDFGIVIEKIGANAKVISNVDPANEAEYTRALSEGVAHAKGTVFPGQKGNIYLFSHSTDAPWNIVRYNAIFYLLGKLDVGDRVSMFYRHRRYDYVIFDKTIAAPGDTHFLTDSYEQSVLTMQTCDPPGTLINRLIIRAKLITG